MFAAASFSCIDKGSSSKRRSSSPTGLSAGVPCLPEDIRGLTLVRGVAQTETLRGAVGPVGLAESGGFCR
jgi:hypothetical protein